jgi:predicted histone-like DNA-binding protein
MSVKFKAVEIGKPGDKAAPKKFYPRQVYSGDVKVREMSADIAEISTVSQIDTKAVLEALFMLIPKYAGQGKIVRLGDLGSLYISVGGEGVDSADKVTANQINKVKLNFRPGKLVKKTLDNIEFEKE